MRQLYLASKSKQRKRLLRQLGIKFKIITTNIAEKRKITISASELVKDNALAKARVASKRIKSGIVVAADTIVLSKNKVVIGKPNNLRDAIVMLKKLSKSLQWVYTGLAVIDIDNKKILTDYEKTKVYMQPLTNKEIKKYFFYVSPLDKAGAFDIDGKGSLFIKRINGCFYNVVGLPMAKLYQMFKKLRLELLFLTFVIYFGGCTTEYNIATQRQETYFFSTEKEVGLGESLSKEYENRFKVIDDIALQTRVNEIGRRLAEVCDRKELLYHFKVVEDKEVNAVSLPGGFVYINSGLIDNVANDDELAGVLAHEIGHIVARHSIKKLQGVLGYTLLSVLTTVTTSPTFKQGVDLAFLEIMTGYSREDELLADKLSVQYLRRSGFNPEAMVTFLEKLKQIHSKEPIRPYNYWRTHPYLSQRIAAAKQEVFGTIEFKDYLNLDKAE